MTSYEEYAKAFGDAYRKEEEERNRSLIAEAQDLSRHVGRGLWPETRQRLEEISSGENIEAAVTARMALNQQHEYDCPPEPFEPLLWDEDS